MHELSMAQGILDSVLENAEKNAVLNGISNAEFICSDAAKAAVKLEKME